MSEQWLTFDEAAEIIRGRLGIGRGHAERIVRDAAASREIRRKSSPAPVLLTTDDGNIDFSMRPGALNKGGVNADRNSGNLLNEDDLLDWLNRTYPEDKPVAPNGSRRGARAKADWDAFELALRQRIEQLGFPHEDNDYPDWRLQADVERWGAEFLEDRKEPIKEARLREKVTPMLARIKAGN
jgi:hypothetical protein